MLLQRLRLMCVAALVLAGVTGMHAQSGEKPQKCIMVVGAHADDVDEMAGGTLARYIAEGYKGVYVGMVNNFSGNNLEKVPGNWNFDTRKPTAALTHSRNVYKVDALETMQVRSEEALQAAAVYGAETAFFDFREPEIWIGRKSIVYGTKEYQDYNPPGGRFVDLATRYHSDVTRMVDLLKKYKPEIVITHTLGAEKLDHSGVAFMVYQAFKEATAQKVHVGKLWMWVNGWLADSTAQRTGRGIPDVHVDVKDYCKTRFLALDKHVSQNGGFGRQYAKVRDLQPKEVVEEFITALDNTAK